MSEITKVTNESSLQSFTWDHLYAIDIQGSHLLADQLEVNRFEEVVSDVLDSPDISPNEPMMWPGSVWNYNEEHAYPLRPQISASMKPSSEDTGCQTMEQLDQLSIDLNAIKLLFGDNSMKLILPHPVIQTDNKDSHSSVETVECFTGSLDKILNDLIELCTKTSENSPNLLKNKPCTSLILKLTENAKEDLNRKTRHLILHQCPNAGCRHKSYQIGSLLNHMKKCQLRNKCYDQVLWYHQCSHCPQQFPDLFSMKRHVTSVHNCNRDAATQFPDDIISLWQPHFCDIDAAPSSDDRKSNRSPPCPESPEIEPSPERNKTVMAALKMKQILSSKSIPNRLPETENIQRFVCSMCGASFNRFDSLNNHCQVTHSLTLNSHDDSTSGPALLTPKYVCKYCDKQFNRKSRLMDHQLGTHEGLKRFWCSQCAPGESRGYKNRLYLRMHQRKCHENSAPKFSCPFCLKCLSSKFYLQKHLSRQHADNLYSGV